MQVVALLYHDSMYTVPSCMTKPFGQAIYPEIIDGHLKTVGCTAGVIERMESKVDFLISPG